MMQFKILDSGITYTGRELRPGWVKEQTGMAGDAAVGFVGPCHVANEDLVDNEDREAGSFIAAAEMAHIIAEHPGVDITVGVLRQRMLVCLLCERLISGAVPVRRDGDDVYVGEGKLTVSVAAPAGDSVLIHLGINVRPDGAPVPAVGLTSLGVDAREMLEHLLGAYRDELAAMRHAEGKVRTVGK